MTPAPENAVVAFLSEARDALVRTAMREPDAEVRAAMVRGHHRAIDRAARSGVIGQPEAFQLRRAAAVAYAEAAALLDIQRDPADAARKLAAEARRRGRAERGETGALMDFLSPGTLRRLATLARHSARAGGMV